MLWYGGTITLNKMIVYFAYNVDKVLLGRFWGAEALGIYGRAYQLVSISTENLNSTLGLVAFPALSRVQQDPVRLRDYFLKAMAVFLPVDSDQRRVYSLPRLSRVSRVAGGLKQRVCFGCSRHDSGFGVYAILCLVDGYLQGTPCGA